MTEAQAAEEAVEDAPVETPVGDEGKAPVKFESPEVEARFKRVYFNMKQNERISEKMAADNAKLVERIEKMESERQKESSTARLDALTAEEAAAMEEGDFQRVSKVRDQIVDLKVDAKVPKPKPVEEKPWLTPEREEYMVEWAAQTDDKGTLLRPWADPDHADHTKMVEMAEKLVDRNPDITLVDLLDHWEIAARKAKPARSAAPVLAGSGDIRPKPSKTALNEDQKLIARRMFPSLPVKDAQERYRKAVEKHS